MPTRAFIDAARPRCDRICGPLSERTICGKPMAWYSNAERLRHPREQDWLTGKWVCPKHAAVLSGVEAAERAGYRMPRIEEAA